MTKEITESFKGTTETNGKNKVALPIDVGMDYVITNGEPHPDTLQSIKDRGGVVLSISNADMFHPKAMPTDRIVFYAVAINEEAYNEWMDKMKEATKEGY